jgi:hypothetical protein
MLVPGRALWMYDIATEPTARRPEKVTLSTVLTHDPETQIEHHTRITSYKKERWNDNPEALAEHYIQSPYLWGNEWKSRAGEE